MNYYSISKSRTVVYTLLALVTAFYIPNSLAEVVDYSKRQQIESIIELTGFDRLIDGLPTFADRSLHESKAAIEPKMWDKIGNAFDIAYSPEKLKKSIRQKLDESYDENTYKTFLTFLNSPLAREMASLEKKANVLAAPEKFRTYLQSVENANNNDPRILLATRLDEATGATKITVNIQAALMRSVFMTVDPRLASDVRRKVQELELKEADLRTNIGEATKKITVASYLLAYQYVSTKKFRDYVEQCESDTVRTGNELLAKTLLNVLNDAALDAVEIIKPKRKRK